MIKKCFALLLVFLLVSTTSTVSAFSLDKYQTDLLAEHKEYFKYIDDITFDVSIAEGIILEPMTNGVLSDIKNIVIDRKAENDKTSVTFEGTLQSMVDLMEEENLKLDSQYKDFEDSIYDLYSVISSFQNEETEYNRETVANRVIAVKVNYSKLLGKSMIEQDAIYQKIRRDYNK